MDKLSEAPFSDIFKGGREAREGKNGFYLEMEKKKFLRDLRALCGEYFPLLVPSYCNNATG